ncbi:MAG: DUF2339 domain-containing protein [Bacteroidetes bacterium]|nr:DUF2339 domain-containing protein [Bacteroidota bacterium]
MEVILVLAFLFPIVITVLLVSLLFRGSEQQRLLESLNNKITLLNDEVSGLSKKLREQKEPVKEKEVYPEPSPVVETAPVVPVVKEEKIIPIPVEKPDPEIEDVVIPPNDYEFPAADHRATKKSSGDIEKFIGENLANKIGIAVLVLGIAFFIKYAIDKNWIQEAGRVITGFVCGSVLLGFAHYYRNTYRSFSSVLVGGGLTVYFISIAFAFHQYGLITQLQAFIAMVVVSAFAVVLSLYYKRQELAILATLGGFLTPFLVSTGQSNYMALFTYLCILNAALTVLSAFKRWPAINILSLFFTTFIYGGWLLFAAGDIQPFPAGNALLFATLFYLLFVAMNIINNVRLKIRFTGFYFIILLSIHFLYYAAGYFILGYRYGITEKGIFTLSLGLFTLLLTAIFYRWKNTDRNFVYLFMGLSITFISLTGPVWLRGNHITLFWLAESVLLYTLYQRSRIPLLKISSGLLTGALFWSTAVNWSIVYLAAEFTRPVIINKGCITGLLVAAGLLLHYWMMRKEEADEYINTISAKGMRNLLLVSGLLILYLTGMLEIHHQFSRHYKEAPLYCLYLQLFTGIYAIVLLQIFRKHAVYPVMKFLSTIFCMLLYVWFIQATTDVSVNMLTGGIPSGLFIAHWFYVLLLGYLLIDLIRYFFRKEKEVWAEYRTVFTWLSSVALVFLLSFEVYYLLQWANYSNERDWEWWRNLYSKAGLSICWGVCSFIMMWLGMKYHFRTLRIISLTLFTITLVKLFMVDIRNIPPGGKIAAFISLGVLLLVVSFMYQRLKKLIIEDKPAEE